MKVSFFQDKAGNFVNNHPQFMINRGKSESLKLTDKLKKIKITKPIYVTGLARSGTTILLEKLSEHPDLVSFRYKDYPFVHIPVWWNNFLNRAGSGSSEKTERAHKDRIKISPDSPEAMEEIVWMSFYKDIHNPSINNILDETDSNNAFVEFYTDTVKKALLSRTGKRYLAKGNYNISRVKLICNIFPDAKFIIAVRNPTDTIASLIKQHKLFCEIEKKDKKVLRYMQYLGHFEFGLDRRPINFGNTEKTLEIQNLLNNDENVIGLAKYWSDLYSYVIDLVNDKSVNQNIVLINYNEFCDNPQKILEKLYSHCELDIDQSKISIQAEAISAPTYYKHGFTNKEIDIIKTETEHVRKDINSIIK